MSERCKGINTWMKGRTPSPETIAKRKGWHHTDEWKKKMSERMSGAKHPMYGKTIPEESKQRMIEKLRLRTGSLHHNSKKVIQLDLQGNKIRMWDCLSDVERALGIGTSCISVALRNNEKTAGGFKWIFA